MVAHTAVSSEGGPQVISVLGMHRSGTSLTARLLKVLGFSLGPEEDLLDARFDNPGGYWEQRPIMEINDAIFEALGGTWWRPPDMSPGWERSEEVEALKPRAANVLESQFGGAERWAWKDPRTSLTLPFWRDLVPGARYVVCLRTPADVIASLLRREPDTHTSESALDLWLHYTARALQHTAGADRLLVFYDDYFDAGGRQLEELTAFTGQTLSELPPSVTGELDATVSGDSRHHRTPAHQLAVLDSVPLEARTMYLLLRASKALTEAGQERDGGLHEPSEHSLTDTIEAFAPRLWTDRPENPSGIAPSDEHQREHDEALTAAHDALLAAKSERDQARSAERETRIMFDRLLEEAVAAAEAEREEAVAALTRERDEARVEIDRARQEKREARIALDYALEELAQVRESSNGSPAALPAFSNRPTSDPSLAEAHAQLAKARAAQVAVERSWSWRVTRPLRAAKAGTHGVRRLIGVNGANGGGPRGD